ncbi:hypothetical protein Cri9333_1913 [Crinalium epipsammum PCC 9333]|uniref:Uncharacterized protein n=1 Tax=Crinalium epipsammum PCC 9333 TaxID=1173022 RepID=K9W047_9CYAN|nr:hypothetical protein [Crinalium epipsammum]AFZ12795.1 hypothetical protein Cri9333_1913 [Crinalium epipsammum PCC 9333]
MNSLLTKVRSRRIKEAPASPSRLIKASINLDKQIQVEEVKNEQGLIVFRFIRFNLDKTSVKAILGAKSRGESLEISKSLLTQLRYFALSDGENSQGKNRFQSGLTFCTYYYKSAELQSENIVMRSVISLDGDIIHQIQRDALETPKKCLAIATSHYWLINQLLNQLRITSTLWVNWVSWGISLLLVAAMVIPYAGRLMQVNFLTLLIPLLMSWLFQQGIKRILRFTSASMGSWALRQLLLRFLSPKPFEKKIAKFLLRRIT